jgi:thiamine phosphate synthase YjbQ (UPF0047 family)
MDMEYAHNLRWGDGNGFPTSGGTDEASLSIPIVGGKLCLRTWQQVVFSTLTTDQNSDRLSLDYGVKNQNSDVMRVHIQSRKY